MAAQLYVVRVYAFYIVYLFTTVSLTSLNIPDIVLSGVLGSTHQLTKSEFETPCVMLASTYVKKHKLKWYGHIPRSSGLAKTMLQGTVKEGRRKGR